MTVLKLIMDWAVDDDAATPPPPRPNSRPDLPAPALDEPDEVFEELSDVSPEIYLDEIYTTIDYTDANGAQTRRRITLLKFTLGANGPYLSAICHERRAKRHFRVDRIDCFIDDDGVVTDPNTFITEFLGIRLVDTKPPRPRRQDPRQTRADRHPRGEQGTPIRQLQARMGRPLALLVAASRCDGMRDIEIDAIMAYLEEEALGDSPQGRIAGINIKDVEGLEGWVRKMRPRRASIPTHLQALEEMGPVHIERFNRALRRVLMADGQISIEEAELYSLIEEWRAENCR